ncbi:hypothetical protein UFOVP991_16 [uncultured Caudovirales phage]|uniref:CCHC-type domain-containing protein n=1 Tax=uncultured Caudovirales phage TaxID=2100421 RepID=A0A6J5PWN7_9CAUD|nr:hypothetical protein UFOVP991_16 [uncultured Caudovirales phage]CAB4182629.1 hypothetical protein UFOVP1076_16 [uncultured Caudovirales phage]CAB4198279.1 hypothetical protein UFOVP1314_59 [uncultured Caudovirales phage]CAB4211286.1 hypothetical protein UFOVP1427_11 [uncultured Caudovirales phage]CAB5237979.1 hypothetical protein UFOVP1523_15 [uncultured Caudovirales phage]
MSDIPTMIADHLSETIRDDAVLGQMLRWLRTMVKATSTVQAASLGVAEDFQELQARKHGILVTPMLSKEELDAFKADWRTATALAPAEAPLIIPAEDFCTYCDTKGHHRGNCPELAASAIAAPLVVCPHTDIITGRLGQKICTACGEDITNLPKKSTFGFQ